MRASRFQFLALGLLGVLSVRAQNLVTGKVVDTVTGAGIAGAHVVLFTHQEARYHAVTDDSGALQFPPIEPGEYRAIVEKSGYFAIPDDVFRFSDNSAPVLQFKLRMGIPGKASLSGQILDPDGAPIPNARVDLIRGPAEHVTTTTGPDGHFLFEKLSPGGYRLRAVPPQGYQGSAVATYFPSSLEESGAQRITVIEKTEIDGFQLVAAPVFRVQGIVRDNFGNALEGATVKRMATGNQPIHVVASSPSYFLALPEGPVALLEEEEAVTGKDGKFEFHSVREGPWQIVAKGPANVDVRTGFDSAPTDTATIGVSADMDVEMRLKFPVSLSGPARWSIDQCPYITPSPCAGGITDARAAPPGVVYPVWLQAVDGQESSLGLAITQSDGMFQWTQVRSGRSLSFRLPGVAPRGLPKEAHLSSRSILPMLFSNAPVQQPAQPLNLEQGSIPKIEGGGDVFDADGTKPPVNWPFRQSLEPRIIQGHVENGTSQTSVVILSKKPDVYFGQLVTCDTNGEFTAQNLSTGEYFVAAFRGVDFAALRDPEIIRKVIDEGRKTNLSTADASVTVVLAEIPWF